jgi:hypothetical protein
MAKRRRRKLEKKVIEKEKEVDGDRRRFLKLIAIGSVSVGLGLLGLREFLSNNETDNGDIPQEYPTCSSEDYKQPKGYTCRRDHRIDKLYLLDNESEYGCKLYTINLVEEDFQPNKKILRQAILTTLARDTPVECEEGVEYPRLFPFEGQMLDAKEIGGILNKGDTVEILGRKENNPEYGWVGNEFQGRTSYQILEIKRK